MTLKKKPIIIITSVLAVLLIGVTALFVVSRLDRGAQKSGNQITSGYFEVEVPESAVITSDNDRGDIYATIPEAYGEIRLSINRSSLNVTQVSQEGDVTTSQVTVDGVAATQRTIDYVGVVAPTSDKLLIRYEVVVDKVEKPSAQTYTEISLTAMSKRSLTNAEKADIRSKADAIIESLTIK